MVTHVAWTSCESSTSRKTSAQHRKALRQEPYVIDDLQRGGLVKLLGQHVVVQIWDRCSRSLSLQASHTVLSKVCYSNVQCQT